MDYLYINNVWWFRYKQLYLWLMLILVGCVLWFGSTYCYQLSYYNTPLHFTYSWAYRMYILPIGYHVLLLLYGRFYFLCVCHCYVRDQHSIHVTSSNFLYSVHAFCLPTLPIALFLLHGLFHSVVRSKLRWFLWASQQSLSDLQWFTCLILQPTPY